MAPAGFIFGGANRSSAEGTSLLGGFGGMAPRENFEFWMSKTAFPAFWRHFKRNIKVLINHFF